jgi:hypothetical protein
MLIFEDRINSNQNNSKKKKYFHKLKVNKIVHIQDLEAIILIYTDESIAGKIQRSAFDPIDDLEFF